MMNLRQITESVIETCQYGVIVELLRGQDYYNEKQKVLYERDESGAMQHEAERDSWAMLQKSEKNFYLLDANLKHEMQTQGVAPDTWVLPPRASIGTRFVDATCLSLLVCSCANALFLVQPSS